jgi:hypothetical protein
MEKLKVKVLKKEVFLIFKVPRVFGVQRGFRLYGRVASISVNPQPQTLKNAKPLYVKSTPKKLPSCKIAQLPKPSSNNPPIER